tara:strand:+ start:5733 stop:6164 length:432 start_codon:yes stop_codon:yes gene_type:complete
MGNLIQYQNHVDFDSKGSILSMQIEYSGRMSIDINVDVKKARITDNKIFITFFPNTQIQDTLFNYEGYLNIKKVRCFGRGRKFSSSIKLIDQTFRRVTDKWDGSEDNWESYDAKISPLGERRRELSYNYKGITIKRKPKTRRK